MSRLGLLHRTCRLFLFSSVFSLYRSLSADDTNKIDNDVDYVFNNAKTYGRDRNDLRVAQVRIKQLEERIAELENRLPKKYDEVKFLNYQNRKRILVSAEVCRVNRKFFMTQFARTRFFADHRRCWLCWFASRRQINETRTRSRGGRQLLHGPEE